MVCHDCANGADLIRVAAGMPAGELRDVVHEKGVALHASCIRCDCQHRIDSRWLNSP